MSRGPLFTIDRMDVGPEELAPQLPAVARLLRMLPGPDKPDYFLAALQRPIRWRTSTASVTEAGLDLTATDPRAFTVRGDGSVDALIYGLVVANRVVDRPLHADMVDLPVALAYVVDPTQMTDPTVDFSKIFYATVAHITAVRS